MTRGWTLREVLQAPLVVLAFIYWAAREHPAAFLLGFTGALIVTRLLK